MQPIDRTGTFRGNLTEWAVSTTKNQFPQFVAKFLATEFYDEDGSVGNEPGAWIDWEKYQMETTGFLVLFGSNGKSCWAYEQLQRALGWDGATFSALDAGDWSNTVVQFHVKEDTFEGVTRLKVDGVDAHNADPVRSLKKLDPKDLKDLDAQFKAQLGATPTPKKVSAPTAPPKPSAPPKTAAPADPGMYEAPAEDPTPDAKDAPTSTPATDASGTTPASAPPSAKRKPGRPKGSTSKKKTDEPAGDGGLPTECTQEEGWEKVLELKDESVTEDKVAEVWLAVSTEIAEKGQGEDDIRPDQWAKVRDGVFDKIPHSKF